MPYVILPQPPGILVYRGRQQVFEVAELGPVIQSTLLDMKWWFKSLRTSDRAGLRMWNFCQSDGEFSTLEYKLA